MNYTAEDLRLIADAKLAQDNGKPFEYLPPNGKWGLAHSTSDITDALKYNYRFRPAVIPKTRPWNSHLDVPRECYLRRKGFQRIDLITGFDNDGVWAGGVYFTWKSLSGFERSVNRIDWSPCEVTV